MIRQAKIHGREMADIFTRRLWKSELAKSVRITGAAAMVSTAIGIVTAPILSRVFDPEAYGAAGLYFNTIALLVTVATLALPGAIPIIRNRFSLYRMIGTLKFIALVVGGVLLLVIALLHSLILDKTGDTSDGIWLWLVPAGVVLGILQATISGLNVRYGQFKKNGAVQVSMAVIAKPLAIALGLVFKGYYLVLIVFDMLSAAPAVALQRATGIRSFIRVRVLWKEVKRCISQFRRYPLFILPADFVSNLSMRSPFLVISALYSNKEAGAFLFANTLLAIPVTVAWNALNPIFLREGTALFTTQKDKLAKLCTDINRYIFYAGLIPVSLLTVFGKEIFLVVFGSQWAMAGTVAQYVAVYYLFRMSTAPLTAMYKVAGVEHLSLLNQMILLAFRVVPLVAGLFFLNYECALLLLSVGSVLGYLFGFWQVGRILQFNIMKGVLVQIASFVVVVLLLFAFRAYWFS